MSQYNEHDPASDERAQELAEVEALASELFDQNLDSAGKRRLERLLQQSAAARRRYAELAHVHVELADHFQPSTPADERSSRPATVLGQLTFKPSPGHGAPPPVSD